MNEIANRLNTYIQSHLFDAGDSGCETVLERYIKPIFNPMRVIPKRFEKAFRNWKNFFVPCHWKTTMQCLPYVATCAASTNGWHSWTACNMERD